MTPEYFLKELSQRHHISVNRLIDEMATRILAESDVETRFLLRAERAQGKIARGIELLEKAKGKQTRPARSAKSKWEN